MCGICGIYSFSGVSPEKETITQINQRMFHRGPDDAGYYFHGPAGLGMRRLSILDTHNGHQPISNETGTIWVVLNGEIYNYIELRNELKNKGHVFRTETDTEVLVHLYEEEGVAGIKKLNGMFAFALYDQVKQAMWIARDRLGIKPLFFTHQPDQFIFSSDLSSIISAIKIKNINEKAFLSYLSFGYVSGESSIYRDVNKLLPGHWLWIDNSGVTLSKYWGLTQFQTWDGNLREAKNQLNDLLDDAMRMQLRSDVPVGISLSGGIDSSAILALSSKHHSSLTAFTIDFIGKSSSDTYFAREIAKKYAVRHVEIPIQSGDVSTTINQLIPFLDEPISDSAILSSFLVAKCAREHGVKVLLNGAGGDEIFGGYGRHHSPIVGSTSWFAERVPHWLQILGVIPLMWMLNKDKCYRLRHPSIAYGAGYAGTNLAAMSDILKNKSHYNQIKSSFISQLGALSTKEKGSYYCKMYTDLSHYLEGDILSLSDKTTMACSVEGRFPLLDHRLVEFAFSLPEMVNILQSKAKGLFCEVLSNVLPIELLSRKKDGFNAPINIWTGHSLGEIIYNELLCDTIPFYKEYFDLEQLKKWIKVAKKGYASETIFRLYLFSCWHKFQEGRC